MAKVRTSQSSEEYDEDDKLIEAIGDTDLSNDEIETLIDQSLEVKPQTVVKNRDDEDGDNEDQVKKFVVHFHDFGITMSLFGIESIDKDMRFVENQCHPRWQYGITINKGIEPSVRFPIVDKTIWFEKEEVRDKRYNDIINTLANLGFKVISV